MSRCGLWVDKLHQAWKPRSFAACWKLSPARFVAPKKCLYAEPRRHVKGGPSYIGAEGGYTATPVEWRYCMTSMPYAHNLHVVNFARSHHGGLSLQVFGACRFCPITSGICSVQVLVHRRCCWHRSTWRHVLAARMYKYRKETPLIWHSTLDRLNKRNGKESCAGEWLEHGLDCFFKLCLRISGAGMRSCRVFSFGYSASRLIQVLLSHRLARPRLVTAPILMMPHMQPSWAPGGFPQWLDSWGLVYAISQLASREEEMTIRPGPRAVQQAMRMCRLEKMHNRMPNWKTPWPNTPLGTAQCWSCDGGVRDARSIAVCATGSAPSSGCTKPY